MPEAAVGCVFNHATILTVYLITVFYFNLWHKVEGEVGKSWSTLIILHRVNPIRDSFSLTISSPTTRIHPSPFDPTYITIPHIHRGGAIMLLFLCRGHISFDVVQLRNVVLRGGGNFYYCSRWFKRMAHHWQTHNLSMQKKIWIVLDDLVCGGWLIWIDNKIMNYLLEWLAKYRRIVSWFKLYKKVLWIMANKLNKKRILKFVLKDWKCWAGVSSVKRRIWYCFTNTVV